MATATTWDRHDLLALDGLDREDLVDLLDCATRHAPIAARSAPPVDLLSGRQVALLFFEDSTRTRCSFAIAAHRLGADTIELGESGSSRSKGETIVDTTLNIEAMGVDAMVIRSRFSGAPDLVAQRVQCPVINAGDGQHEHPTQGLLDIYTLRERLGELEGRTVAIVGDIGNSRVARSNLHGLTTLGANVIVCGPPTLVPKSLTLLGGGADDPTRGAVRVSNDLDGILQEVDAIMMLRVQFERGSQIATDYREHYGLTARRADALRPGVPVMHPGPTNRGLEIDSAVMDDPQRSLIMAQVTNGVAVRMAVLETLLVR